LNVITSSFIIDVLAQKESRKIKKKEEKESVKEKCISYNKLKKLIFITCKYANFADVTKEVTDPNILKLETTITTNTNISENNNKVNV
jgi:hypothetical protein